MGGLCMGVQQATSPITSRAHQALIYSPDLLFSQFNGVGCEVLQGFKASHTKRMAKNGLQALKSDFINQERLSELHEVPFQSYHHGSNHIIAGLNGIDPMQK